MNHLSSLQSCSHIHMTTNLIWTPTVIVDPQLPLTSGQDLWPPPEKGRQASLAGCSGQNNKTISWSGNVLSSCDRTLSPSVVSVRNNKHCGLQLLLLTAISHGASGLLSSVPQRTTPLCSHQRLLMSQSVAWFTYRHYICISFPFVHTTFTCTHTHTFEHVGFQQSQD